jgi:hypothetical protein
VTRAYSVLYVFRLATSMFATIFALVLMAEFVESMSNDRSRAFEIGRKIVSFLLGVVGTAQIGIFIYVTALIFLTSRPMRFGPCGQGQDAQYDCRMGALHNCFRNPHSPCMKVTLPRQCPGRDGRQATGDFSGASFLVK